MIQFSRTIKFAYISTLIILIGGAVGFRGLIYQLDYHLMKKPVELREPLDGIPSTIGEWKQQGEDSSYGSAEIESLGTDKVLTRTYSRFNGMSTDVIEVHVAYYTGKIDSVPHVPERCWATNGMVQSIPAEHVELDIQNSWRDQERLKHRYTQTYYPTVIRIDPITGRSEEVCMPVGDMQLRVTEFRQSDSSKNRLIGGYFFIGNGQMTPSAYGVRSLAFNQTDEYAYYCKVQLNYTGVGDEDREVFNTFLPVANEFLKDFMPELMVRLPNWSEYEANDDDSNEA